MKNYDGAYSEVIEVLNYIPIEDYNKIPKKYITFMEENCDENSKFAYNIALPFEKQDISDLAKDILGAIFRLFIISDTKKEELNIKDSEMKKMEEIEKQIKYNPDNIFKKDKVVDNPIENNQTKEIINIKKENIFSKILNFLKKIFK